MFLRLYWSRMRPGAWDALQKRYLELGEVDVPGRVARWVTQDVNDPESIITVSSSTRKKSASRKRFWRRLAAPLRPANRC